MEFADEGDLLNKINSHSKSGTKFPEKEIWGYFIQMCRGIKALHDLKICHRDLKCANVFLTKEKTLKIGDLNVSKVAKRGLMHTQTGTPYYASPEVWKDKPYDQKSDIWSLGTVLYEMTALKPPFRAQDMNGLMKRVVRGVYPPIPTHFSRDLDRVIAMCLKVTPSQRPSIDELLCSSQVMAHMTLDMGMLEEEEEEKEQGIGGPGGLLGTIRVPRNLGQIGSRLPKPKYGSHARTGSEPPPMEFPNINRPVEARS